MTDARAAVSRTCPSQVNSVQFGLHRIQVTSKVKRAYMSMCSQWDLLDSKTTSDLDFSLSKRQSILSAVTPTHYYSYKSFANKGKKGRHPDHIYVPNSGTNALRDISGARSEGSTEVGWTALSNSLLQSGKMWILGNRTKKSGLRSPF